MLPICFSVIIWTMRLFTNFTVEALLDFKIIRMKFLLLPPVTIRASIFILTTVFIWCYKSLGMPVLTHIFRIVKNRWFSSIVLPIMCINTNISLMVIFSIWTPNCFKMEQVKIHIRFKFFNKFYWQFIFWVSKWAKFSIFTFFHIFQIRRTKLSLIFIRMVEFFNSIMGFVTVVTKWTILVAIYIRTFFWLVKSKWSSSVLFVIMIIRTFFQIMTKGILCTGYCFK